MFSEIYDWIVHLEASTYSVVQTILYALLVLVGLYILYRWLKREKIAIDSPLILTSLTYIILGGLLRVVEDTGMVPDPWWILFITPQVYILTMLFGMAALFVSYQLQKRKIVVSYTAPYLAVGVGSSLVAFGFLVWFGVTNAGATFDVGIIGMVLGIAAAATAGLWAFLRYVCRWTYVTNPIYLALIGSHFLDASATAFALDMHPLHYIEQHVLGGGLIEMTGTAYSMFALKLAVLIPAIWVLEKFRKEEGMGNIWHLVIFAMIVVGLGPGLRDLMRMVLWI
ncbi:MAG: DUF63 family protein [Methanocorpusculum sp.]|nr:DUF63 family protein [Methanocorpusculum sp.]